MEDLPKNVGEILGFLSKYPTKNTRDSRHIDNHFRFNYMIENIGLELLVEFSKRLKEGGRPYHYHMKDSDVTSVYITERNRKRAAGLPP